MGQEEKQIHFASLWSPGRQFNDQNEQLDNSFQSIGDIAIRLVLKAAPLMTKSVEPMQDVDEETVDK
jgi:hypothetical protein